MSAFPLKLAAGKRYLVDQNGVPFQIRGDSGWHCGISLSTSDMHTYFADRQAKGFNATLLYWPATGYTGAGTSAANVNGDWPFLKDTSGVTLTDTATQNADLSTTGSPFFTLVDSAVSIAASYGILVCMFGSYLGFNGTGPEGWNRAMEANTTTQLQTYGTFLGNRYPSVLFIMAGDDSPSDPVPTDTIASSIVTANASALLTAHVADGTNTSAVFGGESWLTVEGVYTDEALGHPWVHTNMRTAYTGQTRPAMLLESCYEFEHSSTDQFLRQQSWEALLNGGMGYFFGSGGSAAPEPLYIFQSGWQTLLNTTGALNSSVLNLFMAARRWDLLVPDTGNTFLTNGGSYTNANFASAAQASDGSWGVVYVPTTEALTIAFGAFVYKMGAWWVDPTNGKKTFIGMFANSGSHTFTPPGANAGGDDDWVLLFELPLDNLFLQSVNT